MNPNWKHLCESTAQLDWDCERGLAITTDLWWKARLFYDRVYNESPWLQPFVSPGGDGHIYFSWNYGFRKLNVEITDGLWHFSEKDGSWHHREDMLEHEVFERVEKFYAKCVRDLVQG